MKILKSVIICMALALAICTELKTAEPAKESLPVESFHSDKIKIENVNFNKVVDMKNEGEILEIEFQISNMTNNEIELYIFTVSTFENKPRTPSSFEMPIPEKDRFFTFEFFPVNENHPNKIDNFTVAVKDAKGVIQKDSKGKEITRLVKSPIDPLKGTDKNNKPYLLKTDKNLIIRAQHKSRYRKNFHFFNDATITIYGKNVDKAGSASGSTNAAPELLYKQNFVISGFKRR